MNKLEVKNLTKVFNDGKEIFRNISLCVESGEILVIIGPSGCGKTTLLRTIAGLEKVTEGEIWMDDVEMTDSAPQERKVGMIFQNYALYPHMTVSGNLSFALEIQKMKRKARKERVAQTAGKIGIASHLNKYPEQLSGGEKQRTAIGRAMAAECNIYLCDEPLSNLHPELRAQIRQEILQLHSEQKKPMIYVTHDQADVMSLATKAIVMKDGEIQQMGTPKELYEKPNNCFVARFLGTPPMNILEAEIKIDSAGRKYVSLGESQLSIEEMKWAKQYKEEKVLIGIRPEKIKPVCQKEIEQGWMLHGKIQRHDNLGSELWIYAEIAGQEILFKEYGTLRSAIGQDIRLQIEKENLCFFDINTQQRLE